MKMYKIEFTEEVHDGQTDEYEWIIDIVKAESKVEALMWVVNTYHVVIVESVERVKE